MISHNKIQKCFYFQIYPFVPCGQTVLDKLIQTHDSAHRLKSSLGSETGLHIKKKKKMIVIEADMIIKRLFCIAAELMWHNRGSETCRSPPPRPQNKS